MLWQVENSDIYFFGTLHMASKSFYQYFSSIEDAYQKASYVVAELRADQIEKVTIGLYTDNITLKQYLSPKTFKRLRKVTSDLNLNFEEVCKMKPWRVANELLNAYCLNLGYSLEHGFDYYFTNRAKLDNKNIKTLETLEESLQVFERWPNKVQVVYLKLMLQNSEKVTDLINKMADYWLTSSTDGFQEIYEESLDHFPSFKTLIDDRNKIWLPKLRDIVSRGEPAFVFVGTLHYFGPNSIPTLLKNECGVDLHFLKRGTSD